LRSLPTVSAVAKWQVSCSDVCSYSFAMHQVLTMSLALIYPYNLNGIDNKFEEALAGGKKKYMNK